MDISGNLNKKHIMKLKKCRYEGCLNTVAFFTNSTIKKPYCQDHFIEYAIEKSRSNAIKQKKIEDSVKKEASRSKSYFEGKLQTEINSIVRLIDIDKGCISCNHGWTEPATRQFHSGHRISIGSNSTLRFNMFNIWKQCSICNNYLSGNERAFDKGILKIYGEVTLDTIKSLTAKYEAINLSKEELKEKIEIVRNIKKDILLGKDYSREEINQRLNIY